MVNKNEWSKIRLCWCFGPFPETTFIMENAYALFTILVKNSFSVKIKTLDRINDFEQVFPIQNNKN